MDNGAAGAFVYSKASGMLAKSFIGKNAVKLFSVRSLSELYTLLFNEEVPAIPEALLTKEIERKAEEKFFSDYLKLVESYDEPYSLLTDFLRFYDYENLKEMGSILALGEMTVPDFVIPQKYSVLNYDKFPDLKNVTKNSPVSWYNKSVSIDEIQTADNRIDIQYIHEIWDSCSKLSSDIQEDVKNLIKDEIVMKNVLWALRLKVYYKMEPAEIKPTLAFQNQELMGNSDIFASDALKILDKDVEIFSDWQDWKYKKFLNPHIDGELWCVDPAWIERSWKNYLNKKTERLFHKQPLSPLCLISFFKLKQNELDCITTVAEGLRLDAGQESMMEASGYSIEM